MSVLIESDWNLKQRCKDLFQKSLDVLIESDWNLKQTNETKRKGEKKQY